MSRSKITQVPVDDNGNWLSYDGGYFSHAQGKYVHGNYTTEITFEAVMKISGMYTGYSAKGLEVTDLNTGKTYHMFVSDFVKTIGHATIRNGVYDSMLWTASKRGSNYGIKPVIK